MDINLDDARERLALRHRVTVDRRKCYLSYGPIVREDTKVAIAVVLCIGLAIAMGKCAFPFM